jgi:hypothetical protein
LRVLFLDVEMEYFPVISVTPAFLSQNEEVLFK